YPTLAKMAAAAKEIQAAVEEEGTVTGMVPLTPVQRWAFEENLTTLNQSMFLKPRERIALSSLEAAIRTIVEQHDMFRARYTRAEADGAWEQTILPPSAPGLVVVRETTVTKTDDLLTLIAKAEAGLDITKGPISTVDLINIGGEQRIYFAVHHLIIDLVSWRILVDDLQRLLSGGTLPPKTWSFQKWATRLETYSNELDPLPWIPHVQIDSTSLEVCR
ncbi:hypothetical protein HK102_013024, partial [Quaeritorhiza haematococci]